MYLSGNFNIPMYPFQHINFKQATQASILEFYSTSPLLQELGETPGGCKSPGWNSLTEEKSWYNKFKNYGMEWDYRKFSLISMYIFLTVLIWSKCLWFHSVIITVNKDKIEGLCDPHLAKNMQTLYQYLMCLYYISKFRHDHNFFFLLGETVDG